MEKRRIDIPAEFTALNGAAQSYTLNVHGSINLLTSQEDLLRVLDILRSNGAQPIITKVTATAVKFTVEQPWCYGKRKADGVSATPKADAIADITALFGELKDVSNRYKIFSSVTVDKTIGASVKPEL